MLRNRKVVMIGCGFVGSASSFALLTSGLFSEIVLIDADRKKAEGEAMDIGHGIPYAGAVKIYAGDYNDVRDAAIVIISAGVGQKPNETRLDLVNKNVAVLKQIIPSIMKNNFDGILLVVSNPVDILTYVAQKLSRLPKERVIGSGTMLDTARLKYEIGRMFNVDSRSVHAFIVGEHGDSEVALWSSANVSGVPLHKFCEMRGHFCYEKNTSHIAEQVKNSAYEIIRKKDATYYGIAIAVKRICEVIVRDEKSIIPVSHTISIDNEINEVAISMPSIVGATGVEADIPLELSENESKRLQNSVISIRNVIETLDI